MKFPSEKVATFLGFAKIIIAGYGVFASVKNLVDSVNEVKTGRSRKVFYVDAGDIPEDKLVDYVAEANKYLEAKEKSSDCNDKKAARVWRKGVDAKVRSGYATGRTRVRKR